MATTDGEKATASTRVDAGLTVGPKRLGQLFQRSRWWGYTLLREWWAEQQAGGPVRVFRRKTGALYTTLQIVDLYMPRGRRDDAAERRLRSVERDLDAAFARIADLERRVGLRR